MFFFVLVHFINLFFIMFLHYRPFYLQRGRQLSRFNREWFSQQYKLLYRLPWRKLTVHAINFLLTKLPYAGILTAIIANGLTTFLNLVDNMFIVRYNNS